MTSQYSRSSPGRWRHYGDCSKVD